MSDLLGLFHSDDPETSVVAAEQIAPRLNKIQSAVLEYLRERGELGATQEEIQEHFGGAHATYRTRVSELRRIGRVVDSGRRRPVRSGNPAVVWVAT